LTKKPVNILAIESSCDDTSAAIIRDGHVLSNKTANQTVHEAYGGVVPELASRQHMHHIIPVIDIALKEANCDLKNIDAVAFTRGPGLLGSLIVGVSTAKALALALDIPLIEVHHMHAHVLAHFAEAPRPEFPFLCLTVSGGHTQIICVHSPTDMEVLGTTLDDAAGEAFDKTGKLLGLPYPAGPEIDRLARQGKACFTFPEPQVAGLNFSFSGLKTSILHFLQKETTSDQDFIRKHMADICASVQESIVHILMKKLQAAVEETGIVQVGLAGGVSANSHLRNTFTTTGQALGWSTYIPDFQYCTDNAGMIGVAGYFKYLDGKFSGQDVTPLARMTF
jgi:N6-L-threonylcarbamoyladenine synthase